MIHVSLATIYISFENDTCIESHFDTCIGFRTMIHISLATIHVSLATIHISFSMIHVSIFFYESTHFIAFHMTARVWALAETRAREFFFQRYMYLYLRYMYRADRYIYHYHRYMYRDR